MDNYLVFKNGEVSTVIEVSEYVKSVLVNGAWKAVMCIPVISKDKQEWQLKTLDCDFHNVKDRVAFARLVECSFYIQQYARYESEISAIEDKIDELTASEDDIDKQMYMQECIEYIELSIMPLFTEEQKAFVKADKFIKFVSVYFSKDSSCFSSFSGFVSLLNNLESDKPASVIRTVAQKVCNNFSTKEDDIYKSYCYNCNAGLANDLIKAYYKGRKINKGKVAKSYDKKGGAIRYEVVLAIIEDLQTKSRKQYEQEQEQLKQEQEQEAKKQAELKAKAEKEAIAKAEKALKEKQEHEKKVNK